LDDAFEQRIAVFCLMVLGVNFCVDSLYAVLNPRLRRA